MDKITIDTYDKSAEKFVSYFAGIGARTDDIETALELTGQSAKSIRVVEIGCGDGRDAAEIISRVGDYTGFDPSVGLLELARKRLPEADFEVADALTFAYPENVDVYFAFASLLHLNQKDLKVVFQKVSDSLQEGGVFYISLKERPEYAEELQTDQFGKRMFYYYSSRLIEELAGSAFESVFEDHQTKGATNWFTIALQKR